MQVERLRKSNSNLVQVPTCHSAQHLVASSLSKQQVAEVPVTQLTIHISHTKTSS